MLGLYTASRRTRTMRRPRRGAPLAGRRRSGSGARRGCRSRPAVRRRIFPRADQCRRVSSSSTRSPGVRVRRNPFRRVRHPPVARPTASRATSAGTGRSCRWGFDYIRGRYGNSQRACGLIEQAFHWYDHGGWLPTGLSLALNTTGRPEQVISGRGAAASTVVINVNVPPRRTRRRPPASSVRPSAATPKAAASCTRPA